MIVTVVARLAPSGPARRVVVARTETREAGSVCRGFRLA